MLGQGRPKTPRDAFAANSRKRFGWLALGTLALGLGFAPATICWAQQSLRLRLEWGGGTERIWEGSIAVSQGKIVDPCPLGIEADEPGSMWLKDDALLIRQRSARTYDGVDLTVEAGLEEQLVVQLGKPDTAPVRIPLADLLQDFRNEPLDNQKNRLVVRRAPGDKLQVVLKESSLVFLPGDTLRMEIKPHLLPLPAGTKARILIQLLEGRTSNVLWQTEQAARVGETAALPVSVTLPNQEGAYEVLIQAVQANWQNAVWSQLGPKPVAERRVQVLVLNPAAPQAPQGTSQELTRVGDEIDPANPRRWEERLAKLPQWAKLAKSRKATFGNSNLQTRQHPLGPVAQLNPSRLANDPSWEAYTLTVNRTGVPHVLEVEYPSDLPQTLGISILEPNAAGALNVGLDSGVDVPETFLSGKSAPRWLRHRLVFWPRTKAPLLLMTNRSDRSPAVYGKIRVLAGWESLPRAVPAQASASARMLAAYLDRPLFPENFSASEALDPWLNRSLDDWQTFYEGGARLVQYLQYAGYEGLMLSVLADGSTIYPSRLVQPTPRYDTGVFFDSGQDPQRKDVLEMLLRMFDRERLRMIPTLEFAAPLPALEEQLRRGDPDAAGLEWIGPSGGTWSQGYVSRRGLAPYYNVLDPRVQEAMLAVVQELLTRYVQHPSFNGLAIKLSGDGYAQLPGPEWGLDDATIARFQRDTHVKVPGSGPGRFAQRAQFLTQEPQQRAWLYWRAEELGRFYRRLQAELTAVKPGCRLYLAGTDLFSAPDVQQALRPALPRRHGPDEALLLLGIDLRQYQDEHAPLLLHSAQIQSGRLSAQAVALEMQSMPEVERGLMEGMGSLFFHPPEKTSILSFDEKSPFRPTFSELLTQPVPAEQENRRRFVHHLAMADPKTMVDGGWMLPMGQEESLRDLILAFRRLPATRFERLTNRLPNESSQPVTIRSCTHANRTWAYVVNDAPFASSVLLRLEAPAGCRVEELSGVRKIPQLKTDREGLCLPLDLDPYDMVALCFSEPAVRFARPAVSTPGEAAGRLATQVRGLGARVGMLGSPAPLEVLRNAGFELTDATDGPPAGWSLNKAAGVTAAVVSNEKRSGLHALHFRSDGPAARLTSEPFEAPATGRLAMSVWLRVADAQQQPPLQLALEGRAGAEEYYRFAPIGQAPPDAPPPPAIAPQWAQYILQVDNVPLEGLTHIRIRLDLLGPGEVWIDDVQVFNLYFSKTERMELSKLVALADVNLQNGQLSDCLHLMDSYWPRFLTLHVPLPAEALKAANVAMKPKPQEPVEPKTPPADRSSFLDRFKNALPRSLRF